MRSDNAACRMMKVKNKADVESAKGKIYRAGI